MTMNELRKAAKWLRVRDEAAEWHAAFHDKKHAADYPFIGFDDISGWTIAGGQEDMTEALIALRERLKAATGPDRELDAAIWWSCVEKRQGLGAPAYTASLDAAVTLVPENISFELTYSAAGEGAMRRVRCWDWRRGPLMIDPTNEWQAVAKSLPLALCLARVEFEIAKARNA